MKEVPRGHSHKACELALAQIDLEALSLELVTTHKFGLKDVSISRSARSAARASRT